MLNLWLRFSYSDLARYRILSFGVNRNSTKKTLWSAHAIGVDQIKPISTWRRLPVNKLQDSLLDLWLKIWKVPLA